MDVPESLTRAVRDLRAKVRFGYPWWLRPLLMRDVIGITLGRRIYIRRNLGQLSMERLLRHELVHIRQINRHGLVGFYARYVAEFARHFVRTRSLSRAYSLISFEIEAVAAEKDL
jgi:hypothetical protein